MDAPTIELSRYQYRLAIICFVKDGKTEIGPGGRGAGEPENLSEIHIVKILWHHQGLTFCSGFVLTNTEAASLEIMAELRMLIPNVGI